VIILRDSVLNVIQLLETNIPVSRNKSLNYVDKFQKLTLKSLENLEISFFELDGENLVFSLHFLQSAQ